MAWSHKQQQQQQQQMNMYFKLQDLWTTMDKIYVELQKGALSFQQGQCQSQGQVNTPCKTFDIFAQIDHCSKHTSAIPLLNWYNHLSIVDVDQTNIWVTKL